MFNKLYEYSAVLQFLHGTVLNIINKCTMVEQFSLCIVISDNTENSFTQVGHLLWVNFFFRHC